LALSNIGVYGATSFMFAVGYLGGYGALVGYGRAAITQAIIGWMVVPIGVFIYLYILASLFGVANLFLILGTNRFGSDSSGLEGDFRRSDLRFWGVLIALVSTIFILLPILEIPYYPNNYLQEVAVMSVSIASLVGGLSLLAYGGLTHGWVREMAAKGERSATV